MLPPLTPPPLQVRPPRSQAEAGALTGSSGSAGSKNRGASL